MRSWRGLAYTASPGLKPRTRGPVLTTTPARSLPSKIGSLYGSSGLSSPLRIFRVQGIDAGGVDLDQDVVVAQFWLSALDSGDVVRSCRSG